MVGRLLVGHVPPLALNGLRWTVAIDLVGGDLLMMLAVCSWAGYSWMLARPLASMRGEARPSWDWAEFLLIQVIFGSAWGAAAAGIEAVAQPASIHWSLPVIAAIAYVAIGPSILAYAAGARAWLQSAPRQPPSSPI